MAIQLLIADDDPIVREGLKLILDLDDQFEVVACVENGQQAVEFCLNHPVDVAMLDIRMPVMSGVQAAEQIASQTKAKSLILTTFDDDELIVAALQNGAKGYLLKTNPPEKIKDAIRVVYGGNTVMQDAILDKIKKGLGQVAKPVIDRGKFTERELEVMEGVAEGLSNREIAGRLYISEGTVANYITSIFNKTGLEHRTQIAIYQINKLRK